MPQTKEQERKRRLRNRKAWDEYIAQKFGNECQHPACSYGPYLEKPVAFDLHHLNPQEKKFKISAYTDGSPLHSKRGLLIKEEIEKCVLLCACCHRLYHKDLITLEGIETQTNTQEGNE